MEEFVAQRLGRTLGRWTLEHVLGVGGMAAVYAGKDAAGAEVAVKILHPELSLRSDLRDRFLREGYVANRVAHAGAVQVLEHGAVDDRSVFLVMERLRGESLGERLARHGTLPLPELLDVLDQVLDVLAVAHDAGIVHRDLKPDNLFLTEGGRVKVLDFGLARVLDGAPGDVKTRTGMAMGTLPYMAPEQALGKRSEIDGRVDLFALGATAFRILSRRRIHEADSEAGMLIAMASKAAPPLRSVAPEAPEGVAAIVDLALAFHRDARYPDARTMQTDVRAVQRGDVPAVATARLRAREEATRVPGHAVPAPGVASDVIPAGDAPTRAAPPEVPTAIAPPSATREPTVAAPAVALAAAAPAAPATPAPAPAAAPHVPVASRDGPPAVHAPWLLPVAAAGCLLLGAALYWLWSAAGDESAAESEAVVAESEASSSPPAEVVNAAVAPAPVQTTPSVNQKKERERQKKSEEQARERAKKTEEQVRERIQRAFGREKERDKR